MNLLLVTHVALWAITDDAHLSDTARKLISAPHNTVWVSAASVWEITINYGLGCGNMPISGRAALSYFHQSGYRLLSIAPEHAVAVASLLPHHQDPFACLLRKH